MSYLDEIELELRELLAQEPKFVKVEAPEGSAEYENAIEELAELYTEWEDKVLKLLRIKVLDSFKNGVATERKRKQKNTEKAERQN